MKRIWIKRAVIGSILIAIIVVGLGFAGYKWAKQYYYDQLESTIVNRYLEGRDAIGAISSYPHISTILNPTGCSRIIKEDLDGHKMVYLINSVADTVGAISSYDYKWIHMDYTILNDDIINLLDNKYSWFIMNSASDESLNCMIMKKTNRGFDFIEEKIVGVGFNYFPQGARRNRGYSTYWIDLKDFILYKQYVDYLTNDIYKDIFFRYEDAFENSKYQLLSHPRRSVYFFGRYIGNKYYELRPDPYYKYVGASAIEGNIRNYGNYLHMLYGRSITAHYSIQERGTVLEDTFLKRTSIAGVGLILAYIIFCAIMNNKKVKS